MAVINSATPKAAPKHDLLFNKPEAGMSSKAGLLSVKVWGRFVEQRLMLSSNFRCDQIYKYKIHDFGQILLCYLSRT